MSKVNGFTSEAVNRQIASVLNAEMEASEFTLLGVNPEHVTKKGNKMELGTIKVGNVTTFFSGYITDIEGNQLDSKSKFWKKSGNVLIPDNENWLIGCKNFGSSESPRFQLFAQKA